MTKEIHQEGGSSTVNVTSATFKCPSNSKIRFVKTAAVEAVVNRNALLVQLLSITTYNTNPNLT